MVVTAANIYVVPVGNRRAVMLELETDSGLTGLGEAGIAYGAGSLAVAEITREMVQRFVIDQDPSPVSLIWNTIYDNSFWTKGGGAISIAGLSAIDHALWDIKGKTLGVPVYSLFGGPFTDRLETYANGWWAGCDTPAQYAAAAARTVSDGYTALKLYPLGVADPVMIVKHPQRRAIGRIHEDIVYERCAAIRAAVGPQVEILLDFGGGLAVDQLLPLLHRLEPLAIGFVEEPVDPGLHQSLGVIARSTHIPIAAGERLYTRSGFQTAMSAAAFSIVQPDVCNTGGLAESIKIAAMAESQNMRVSPHNYGGPLATVVSAHLAASIPNFRSLEIFPYFDQEPGYVDLIDKPLEKTLVEGRLPLPTGPGLGVSLVPEAVRDHLFCRVEGDSAVA